MSGPESVGPMGFAGGDQAAMMALLLREWALLRERESDLLRRMTELLEWSSHGRAAVDKTRDAAVETGAPQGDLPGDSSPHFKDDAAWIDRTIEAVLTGAFSAESEPEAIELPAVDLLLLRSGDTWVGMPWDRVTRLGLSEDAQPVLPCGPLSLREILGLGGLGDRGLGDRGLGDRGLGDRGLGDRGLGDRGLADRRDDTAEPYCLTWETAGGPRSLCCEVLGGVLAASAAATREVDLVWLPDDSEAGGRLLPLVEFFASIGRDGREEVEALDHRLDDTAPMSGPTRAMAHPAFAESQSAPTFTPPITEVGHDLDPDLRGVPPSDAVLEHAVRAAGPQEIESCRRSGPDPSAHPGGMRHLPCLPGGARSALVSVRYLPARVAIARALRSHGWFVLEAADAAELPTMLQQVHHTVVFTEAPERPEPGWTKELVRAQEGGARIIGVASRLRGTAGDPWPALGTIPRLLYPFQEAELDRLIESSVPSELG